MSKITITCPDCGKKITVDIRTIDTLKDENFKLKAKVFYYEQQLDKVKNNPFNQMFGGGFK